MRIIAFWQWLEPVCCCSQLLEALNSPKYECLTEFQFRKKVEEAQVSSTVVCALLLLSVVSVCARPSRAVFLLVRPFQIGSYSFAVDL